ncbi:MAG TPA: hypothetical protein VK762_06550 [Polyangiaceae bacterium]|nr:hypothetical protein [Polyangiaceae bacterium]
MAYPGDPSGPAAKGSSSFAGGRLSPDDLDQLAAAFRPSWEFDEAPFVGAGTMSPGDLHALQGGGGTHADIRAVAQAAAAPAINGAHAPPKPAVASHEPEDSVIIDRSITAAALTPPQAPPPQAPPHQAPLPPPPAAEPVRPVSVAPPPAVAPMAAPVLAPMAPSPVAVQAPRSADRLAQTRIVRRSVQVPVPRESTGSFDARALGRSKRPLWIGLGAGAVVLVAVGIWATSGSSSEAPAPAAPAKTVQAAAPDIPPPPPETTPEPPPAPPPKTVSVMALPQVAAPPVVTPASLPQAPAARPAPPPAAAPPPAPVPHPAAAPAAKPAAHPKPAGGGTIVHDVPF